MILSVWVNSCVVPRTKNSVDYRLHCRKKQNTFSVGTLIVQTIAIMTIIHIDVVVPVTDDIVVMINCSTGKMIYGKIKTLE